MSSAENGSSIRMMSGSSASVCARLVRLRMPPRQLVRVAVAEAAQADAAQPVLGLRAAHRRAPRNSSPAITLPSAVRQGIRLSAWNM